MKFFNSTVYLKHIGKINFLSGLLAGTIFFNSPIFFLLFAGALVLWLNAPQRNNFLKILGSTFLFFWGFFIPPLYWVPNALLVEIETFGWMIPICFFGLPAILASIYASIFSLFSWRSKQGAIKVVWTAALWVISEKVSSFIFTGFPWALLGYAWKSLPVLQLTGIIKIYGLSFFSILLLGIPYVFLCRRKSVYPWVVMGLWGIIYLYGYLQLSNNPTAYTQYGIRLVQPNIAQAFKWDPSQQGKNLNILLDLSNIPSNIPLSIIVWPEDVFNLNLNQDGHLRRSIAQILPEKGILSTGAVRHEENRTLSSLLVINKQGQIIVTYDKHHLVPFGEYIPLRKYLENIIPTQSLRKITAGLGDFNEGQGPKTIKIGDLPPFSPLICYEAIFSGQIVDRHGIQPSWLLNLTNDAWFGNSDGPHQHLQIARIRAIEEGLPLIRVANTGISAVIDPCGRVLNSIPLNTRGIIDVYLPRPLKGFFHDLWP